MQHEAVEALGGTTPAPSVERYLNEFEAIYLRNMVRERESRDAGKKVQARVWAGSAWVAAELLAKYYQETGNADQFALWEYRTRLAHGRAFGKAADHAEAIVPKDQQEGLYLPDEEEPDFLIAPNEAPAG
jgi:hypothetical protein